MDLTRRKVLLGAGLITSSLLLPTPSAQSSVSTSKVFNSVAELQLAINSASSGDLLILAAGTYTDAAITVTTHGLTIRAELAGKVIFNGSSHIVIKSDHTVFSGFQFLNGEFPGIVIRVFGSDNKVEDLNFFGYSAKKYINLEAGSQRNEISYCNFENKPATAPMGNLVGVIPDSQIPGYHRIRFCSFKNNPGAGGDNGNEPIRLGDGAVSTYISRTIVEYCYWENTGLGDSENVSIKCRENIVRYCTFKDNQDGALVFRNGINNMAYGNSFINAGGIRIKEASNIFCFDNYFENSGIGGRASAVNLEYLENNLNNINFLSNTFINCGAIILGGTGPLLNCWANNLFVKPVGAIFSRPNQGTQWLGNIYQGSLGLPPTPGLKAGAPRFTHKANDYYRPTLTTPTKSASVAGFSIPAMYDGMAPTNPLGMDLFQNSRPLKVEQWDVGAIQYSRYAKNFGALTAKSTGPRYN